MVYHKNRPCSPEALLKAIAPYREGIVIGVECVFCWYWIADLCQAEGLDFVLGHALYMKAIHGPPAGGKNDRIDSLKVARLLHGGNFPLACVYPPTMRATRDLMRRRIHFVRKRAELLAHSKPGQPVQPAAAGDPIPSAPPAGQGHHRALPRPGGPADGPGRPATD